MCRKKTIDEFKNEIKSLVNNEYNIISKEYNGNKEKIRFKHNYCGAIFEMRPNNFLNGQRCPYCKNKNISLHKTRSHEEFLNIFYSKVNKEEYKVLNKYVNNLTKIKIKHNKCGYINEVTPNSFLNQPRCPYCSKKVRKDTEYFKNEIIIKRNNEYSLIDNYINNHTKVKIKHNKCNYITEYYPNDFINKYQNCPYCYKIKSKGEIKIENYLIENNYEYIYQYKIKDCKNIKELPFDFKLENDVDNKIILIEYDGIQHFEKAWFDTEEDFINRQKRDEIKNKYCKQHCNIDLYRIKYTDFNNIESILETIIKHYE